ncbi:hypothetical protein NEIMUCOT_04548 [Neisseria mucosa ATCC 25996]|uniref:Uncharacterized protein n=1 Tax=Neisseria mucosa (strain ATCC 25996 / DSM 4631 / NCTC 10774 / M26) TaxID=546266 RepID=D2ZVA5_NEIM2|nr:hypothetical protein NEIMUCOT_04548 [Neisseria mucosa ATCC 25996]
MRRWGNSVSDGIKGSLKRPSEKTKGYLKKNSRRSDTRIRQANPNRAAADFPLAGKRRIQESDLRRFLFQTALKAA